MPPSKNNQTKIQNKDNHDKITPRFLTSQAESCLKNKKNRIKRTNSTRNDYLSTLNNLKPQEISHKEGLSIRSLLSAFTARNLKVTRILVKQIIKSGNNLSNKARDYFKASVGFKSNQTISRLTVRLEQLGLISVDQFVKETNYYSLGPVLKDAIAANYLVKYLPELRFILPGLFSLLLLSSANAEKLHSERNVSQLRDVILINSLKNKQMKNEVKSFEHDFVNGPSSYTKTIAPSSWVMPKGVVHPHIFRDMSNVQRKKYFHANGWGHKDTDKGWVPVSQKLHDVLTCVEKWEEYKRSKK